MEIFVDVLSAFLLFVGVFLGISGAIGLFRFPDFYTRMHAAGITDTLCTACIMGGLILQAGFTLISVKLFFILLFTFNDNLFNCRFLSAQATRVKVKTWQASGNFRIKAKS